MMERQLRDIGMKPAAMVAITDLGALAFFRGLGRADLGPDDAP
jgi:hypothetical protein